MSDLRELDAEFARALRSLESWTKFAEALAQSDAGQEVTLDRRSVTPSREPRMRGAVLRAWGPGRWVEAATSSLNAEGIGKAASAVADALSKTDGGSTPPGPSSTLRQDWNERPARPMRDLGMEAMIAHARDAFGWATSVAGVHECQIRIGWTDEERFYMNTAGARCYQLLPKVFVGVVPVAMENGQVDYDYLGEGGVGGAERLGLLNEEKVRNHAQGSVELLKAKEPPTGRMAVVLDPGTTGTFAHESFGHGTEADQFVRDRSYLRPLLGSMLGPEFLTIVDAGSYPDGWGTIRFDDEGNPAQRTALVDHGRFVGALHDRETAAALHARPTGNARRSDFLSRLFVRMTNTYVEAGDWSLDDLVREAKDGVLLEHTTSGIEDPLGGQMQIKVKKGRLIEHGQLTSRVKSMALSGRVLDVLKDARGLSRQSDFEMGPGYCGKGHTDLLPVASGGTYLLSTAIVGPA